MYQKSVFYWVIKFWMKSNVFRLFEGLILSGSTSSLKNIEFSLNRFFYRFFIDFSDFMIVLTVCPVATISAKVTGAAYCRGSKSYDTESFRATPAYTFFTIRVRIHNAASRFTIWNFKTQINQILRKMNDQIRKWRLYWRGNVMTCKENGSKTGAALRFCRSWEGR